MFVGIPEEPADIVARVMAATMPFRSVDTALSDDEMNELGRSLAVLRARMPSLLNSLQVEEAEVFLENGEEGQVVEEQEAEEGFCPSCRQPLMGEDYDREDEEFLHPLPLCTLCYTANIALTRAEIIYTYNNR